MEELERYPFDDDVLSAEELQEGIEEAHDHSDPELEEQYPLE